MHSGGCTQATSDIEYPVSAAAAAAAAAEDDIFKDHSQVLVWFLDLCRVANGQKSGISLF